jgi:hypothetical protein
LVLLHCLKLSIYVANLIIYALVAPTARLEAVEKALSEEKVARLAADRTSAEEKTARQVADQSPWASKEAKAALVHDLQSAQASLIAITEKSISKSSALDFVLIREREVTIKLQATKEKIKAQLQSLAST